MTEAIISVDSKLNFSCLAYCDKADLVSSGTSSSEQSYFFQHAYSTDTKLSTIVGCNKDRKVIVVNGNCDGMICQCRNYAVDFLQCTQINKESMLESVRDNITNFPLLVVVATGDICFWISCLSAHDIELFDLFHGVYTIQHFSLSVARKEHLDIMNFLHGENGDLVTSDSCAAALSRLHETVEFWPNPAVGTCIGLSDNAGQVTSLTLDPRTMTAKRESIIPRPKGPITGFNFFSKLSRKRVFEDLDDKSLTNNDLNKALGKRWKNMPNDERAPYLEYAKEDRQRYLHEMIAFRQLVDPTANFIDETYRPTKPLTAYNLFVHQEKQFVMGCDISDTQTRIGKHGGDRWGAMPTAEKDLYNVLRDVGARDYI